MNSARTSRGFTLLEVMGALVVFVSFFLAIVSMTAMSYKGAKDLHYDVLAEQVMGTKMADLRAPTSDYPTPSSGTTTVDGIDFTWTVDVFMLNDARVADSLRELRVSCSWDEPSGRKVVSRRVLIAYPQVVSPPPPTPDVSQPNRGSSEEPLSSQKGGW